MSDKYPKIIKQNINFLENPLWITDIRDKRHEFTINLQHGQYTYRAAKDNIPDNIDAVFLYYFLWISQQTGCPVFRLTRYQVLKDCKFSMNTRVYERLKTAINRWSEVNIHFQGSFYITKEVKVKGKIIKKKIRRHVDKYFHIMNALIVRDEDEEKGSQGGFIRVSFDPDFLKSINESLSIRDIDFKIFIALKDPLARRLYEWLPKQFISRNIYKIGIAKFFEKMRIVPTTYPSVIKRKLKTIEKSLKRINDMNDHHHQYRVALEGQKPDFFFVFTCKKKVKSEVVNSEQTTLPFSTRSRQYDVHPEDRHENFQSQQTSQPELSNQCRPEIEQKFQDLGFTDAKQVGQSHSNEVLQSALADLQFNIKEGERRGQSINNPGAYLRQLLPEPRKSYQPSPLYKKHLKDQDKRRIRQKKEEREKLLRDLESSFHRLRQDQLKKEKDGVAPQKMTELENEFIEKHKDDFLLRGKTRDEKLSGISFRAWLGKKLLNDHDQAFVEFCEAKGYNVGKNEYNGWYLKN